MMNTVESPTCTNPILGDVFSNPYLMPSEYKGEYTKNGGLTKFQSICEAEI
jgi:hypothetical protein